MKTLALLLSLMLVTLGGKTAHDFSFKSLTTGKEVSLSKYKGKKILIVNTASECGYTPQYKDLQKLAEQNAGKLVIIGFPTNDFGAQEPGSNKEIAGFCEKNYGVKFPMSEKITVKGDKTHALYQWLTQKSMNGVLDATVKWNFNKFLIDEEGNLIAYFPSSTSPLSDEIKQKLK